MQIPQTIQVLVRARPASSDYELEADGIKVDPEKSVVSFTRERKGQSDFQFTKVFDHNSSQRAVYEMCNIINDVVEGINCCIMAYGQTGSGKTYTMYGWEDSNDMRASTARIPDSTKSTDNMNDLFIPKEDISFDSIAQESDEDSLGIIPRSVADLFKVLDEKAAANPKFDYSVSCQIMQIYNEKIFDLMQDKRRENPLQLRDTHKNTEEASGSSGTVHVRGMSVYRIYSKEEAVQLLKQGMRNRAIRATDFNSESSRSHTILQFFVTAEDVDEQGLMMLKRSTFSLVDLAGSEKWRSSLSTSTTNLQAEALVQAQMKEMNNINTSLHVLGNCVSALIEPNRKHIPFRDSALTRLLQDPLGGDGRTILIATLHADAGHKEETYSTLQFASRASRIKVALTVNVGINERANLVEAQRQIKLLRAKLQELQQAAGPGGGRSRDGSVSPSSGRLRNQEDVSSSGLVGGVCQLCADKDKLIAALRLKVIEQHKENQALRGCGGGSASAYDAGPPHHFRTPRKLLPSGGSSSNLTKMSPSLPAQPADTDWLNSSMSSVDNSISAAKKKKKTSGVTKLRRTGSKGSSRATTLQDQGVENAEATEREEQYAVNSQLVTEGISAIDQFADTNSSRDGVTGPLSAQHQIPQSPPATGVAPTTTSAHSTVAPSQRASPQKLKAASSPKTASTPNINSNSNHGVSGSLVADYRIGDSSNSLRFSDSSIDKALKAANLVLNAPPSSSLTLLNLMSQADGLSRLSSKTEKKKDGKVKASPLSSIASSPEREYGERVDVGSPSPLRHPTNNNSFNGYADFRGSGVMASPLQQPQQKSANSTASNSFDSANLRRSVSDYLDPVGSDGMMSPPTRKPSKTEQILGASHSSSSIAELSVHASNNTSVISATAEAPVSTPYVIRGLPNNNSSSIGAQAPATSAPLPLLTPARKAIIRSNPDACAKHGLDQCVLCRMFGDADDGAGASNYTGGSAVEYNEQSIKSNYNQPAARLDPYSSILSANNYEQPMYHNNNTASSQNFNNNNNHNHNNGYGNTGTAYSSQYSPHGNSSSHHPSANMYEMGQGQQQQQQQEVLPAAGHHSSERRKKDKSRKPATQQEQQVQLPDPHNDFNVAPASSQGAYNPPHSLQLPSNQPLQQQQWQNHSSDFSPSGIYGNTLNMIHTKNQQHAQPPQLAPSPPMQQHSAASYLSETPLSPVETGPVTCKLHRVSDCLLCQMRGVDVRKSKNAMNDSQLIQQQQYQQQQQQQQPHQNYSNYPLNDQLGGYGGPSMYANNTNAGNTRVSAAGAPSPHRLPPQEFISTVDSSDQLVGYGFQNSPGTRSQSSTSKAGYVDNHSKPQQQQQQQQQQRGTGRDQSGSNIARPTAYQDTDYQHYQHQNQPHTTQQPPTMQSQGAQVRNIKQISQQRQQQQQQQLQPPLDQNRDFSPYSGTGLHYPPGSHNDDHGAQQAQRSMYGNSVQTVHALRLGGQGGESYYQRSTSSPLPFGQPQSILPSIINEYEFHNQQQQRQQQQQHHVPNGGKGGGGGGNITYLEDDDEEGEEEGPSGDDDESDQWGHPGTGTGTGAGKSQSQLPAGRAVIKKKKKVKKKVTRKVPAGGGAAAAAPAPYGSGIAKKRI